MGSGISLNKEQIVCIIQREIDNKYLDTIQSIRSYTDEGYFIYETFEHETEYNDILQHLRKELAKIKRE